MADNLKVRQIMASHPLLNPFHFLSRCHTKRWKPWVDQNGALTTPKTPVNAISMKLRLTGSFGSLD